ncbi:MAG: DUF885 domain-containing protein [Luminiphilus sp.]|nr:DUF885 domain-containing protein [Luminiphilus sp.]
MINKVLVQSWVWVAVLGLSACGESETEVVASKQQDAVSEHDRLKAYLAEVYEENLARRPFTASYLGRKDRQGEWNSQSEAFQNEERTITTERLAELDSFDREALPLAGQLSLDLYQMSLERSQMMDDFRHHQYAIHQYRGAHTSIPSSLINIHSIQSVADAEAYIDRLNNVRTVMNEMIEQLSIRSEKGLQLVDWMYPKIKVSATNVITGQPFDDGDKESPVWSDFQTKVRALELPEAEEARLINGARDALIGSFKPAYLDFIATVDQSAANASTDDGIWRFPEGGEYYQRLLRWFTTTDLTADEVHELGLQNVARIHGEMRAIQEQVGFEGSLKEFFVFVRENKDLRYPNTDEGRADYLEAARDAIARMEERLPDYFGILPEAEMVVKRVEPFREQNAGKAFYQSPPPDGSRPGIYYANLYDMSAMPKTDLEALAFHEGLPGHHLQRAITAELKGVPDVQRYLSFTAFSEGWGLYTEQLAYEMGFYEDPYSRFGQLAMELWRAARLVVDTGIHHKRWTREEAIDYLVTNTPNAKYDCIKAIERYIAMPGQATAYMIGKLKILELRENARDALGDDFDIRVFHDTVLGSGPVPLSKLADNIEAMIEAEKG